MGLRCFVAIELPEQLRRSIGDNLAPLRVLGKDVKWVRPDNIHITLKFLGEVHESRLEDIKTALNHAVAGLSPIQLFITGTGAFPNQRRPSVLWVGLKHPPQLLQLYSRIEAELVRLGFAPDERSFSPHLTVARTKRGAGGLKRLMADFGELENKDFGSLLVEGISLMKSDLKPSGALYTRLARCPLTGQ